MEIMNICVLHLSDVERDTGSGVDREELIQWYLEQKETEFETEEDLEYERELIAKALTKLSRVSLFLKRENAKDSLPSSFPPVFHSSILPPHLLLSFLHVFPYSFYLDMSIFSVTWGKGEREGVEGVDQKKGETETEREFETYGGLRRNRDMAWRNETWNGRGEHVDSTNLLISRITIYLKFEETSIRLLTRRIPKMKPWTMKLQQIPIRYITSSTLKSIYPTFLPHYPVFKLFFVLEILLYVYLCTRPSLGIRGEITLLFIDT